MLCWAYQWLPLQALTVSSVADNDGMEDCQAPVPLVVALAAGPAQRAAAATVPQPCPAPVSSSTPELATNSCVGSSNQSPNQGGRCSHSLVYFTCNLGLHWRVVLLSDIKQTASRSTANAVPHAAFRYSPPQTCSLHSNMPSCHVQSRSIFPPIDQGCRYPPRCISKQQLTSSPLVCRAEAIPHLQATRRAQDHPHHSSWRVRVQRRHRVPEVLC